MADSEKLSEVVSARFTPSEIAELKALAGDGPVSHVVREAAVASLRDVPARGSRTTPLVQTVTSPGNRLLSVMTSLGVAGRQPIFRRDVQSAEQS